MDSQPKERWQELCFLVTEERDPHRVSELVAELLKELQKREERLRYPAKAADA